MSREIVIIMGYNAAGSTLVESYQEKGYIRFNRDITGNGLDDLAKDADKLLRHDNSNLDNKKPAVGRVFCFNTQY